MSATPLLDRIRARETSQEPREPSERVVARDPEERIPEWVRRARAKKLPPKEVSQEK